MASTTLNLAVDRVIDEWDALELSDSARLSLAKLGDAINELRAAADEPCK